MKVLRISTRIYPDIGGPAKQAFLISKILSEKSIKVTHISCIPQDKTYVKKEEINPHFIIYYLPLKAPGYNASLFTFIVFFFKFLFYGIAIAIKIYRKEKFQIIHSHSPPPSGIIALFFHKLYNIRYYYTLHGLDYPNSLILNYDIKKVMQNSIKTFIISEKVLNFISSRYRLENLIWMPNGIETSQYFHAKNANEKQKLIQELNLESMLSNDNLILSYIGYMIFKQKVLGMLDFLDAFHIFIEKIVDINQRGNYKLLFIGGGKYSYLLNDKINEKKLNENVFILGKRNDINRILAISDLLALTSYLEGAPNVLLEAMASNVSCLATNVGDIKRIIGDTGYLTSVKDVNSMVSCLKKHFLSANNINSPKRNKPLKRVNELFDINIIVDKFIEYYLIKE